MRIALLSVLVGLLWGIVPARQETPASVRPAQDDYVVSAGVETTVVFRLENATEVYGIDVRASYDPALVEVLDTDPGQGGIQIQPGQLPQPDFVARQDVDPGMGLVWYVVTQVNPTPPANGSGSLFTVRLRGRGTGGSAEFRIDSVEMSDRDGNLLPVQWESAVLQVEGGAGQGAEATSIIFIPTTSTSVAIATSNIEKSATPPSTYDTPPTVTLDPLPTDTLPSTTGITIESRETTVGEPSPPVAAADTGPGEIFETVPEADKALVAPVATVGGVNVSVTRDSGAAGITPSAAAPSVANRRDADPADEVVSNSKADLAIVGEGQSVPNMIQADPSGSSREVESFNWPFIIAVGAVILVVFSAIVITRHSG